MSSPGSDSRPEFALIDWIAKQSCARPEVLLGIGDDAAVLDAGARQWVVTLDVLTAGVHFEANENPALIGRKALAVNLSDIAAMAAEPCAAFVGIVLPKQHGRELAEGIYAGLGELAREFNVCVAGGDTNSWDGPLVISVTLLGLATERGVARRDGARPGDWMFVTGPLGGSLASGRHLRFTPRVREALALHQAADLHALLDISDGLASDLFHILDRSGVGARIDTAAMPIHADVNHQLPAEERLRRALCDGEDFELLFTVDARTGARLLNQPPAGVSLTRIGEITAGSGAVLAEASGERPLERGGWAHEL